MNRTGRKLITALAAALAAGPALADWTGQAEAGLVIASGNTETQTVNLKLRVQNQTDSWKHSAGASGLYAADQTGTISQRWEVFGEADHSFSQKSYWFGASRYEQDKFSGFEYQSTASSGLGRKFIDTDAVKFNGALGLGYKFSETPDAFDEAGVLIERGRTNREGVLRGALDLDRKFTPTTSLTDKFIVESGADNTFVRNDASLQVKINAVLALAVGYSVRYNSSPPAGFDKTDTLTTVSLVYELK